MSDELCPYETAVAESARTGDWNSSLRAHVRECAACTESARVTEWIAGVATYFGREQSPPDPAYLLLRAEIEKQAAAESALSWRRLGMAGLLGLAAGIVGSAAVLAVLAEAPAIMSLVSAWLSLPYSENSLVDGTVIGTLWLGLPSILTVVYLFVLRPIR